jgi:ribosomal protein L12E/L44/L45/RPP1/RPP2
MVAVAAPMAEAARRVGVDEDPEEERAGKRHKGEKEEEEEEEEEEEDANDLMAALEDELG